MKKVLSLIVAVVLFSSCGNDELILPKSVGAFSKVLVVAKTNLWLGDVGKEIKTNFEDFQLGLPQAEKILSVSQIKPEFFSTMMTNSRNILVVEVADKEVFKVNKDVYARPQIVIYLSAKDKESLVKVIKERSQEIMDIFKQSDIQYLQNIFAKKRLDDSQYKTFQNLNISLTIPEEYRTVDDTGEFLWLRQHLKTGIAKGDSNNNIVVYSRPLDDETAVADSIISVRNAIGKKYLPGSKEGMYMITEEAYNPYTIKTEIEGNEAFETRGKWEVKNDWMAGPFINYSIIDKKNNRLLVVEGFTYAPSVSKRNFILELEAIAKSIHIN